MHDAAAQDKQMPDRVVERFSVFGVKVDPESVAQPAKDDQCQCACREILYHWFNGDYRGPAHHGIKREGDFLIIPEWREFEDKPD